MISYRNITKIYPPGYVALENICLEIKRGELVSVVGRSGAGKTTLLKLLIGEERPTAGQVFFDNVDVHQIKSGNLPEFRRNIGMVFQDYKLLESKTAYENITYVLEFMGLEEETVARDAQEVLEIVGLTERMYHFPAELSGGEKQRVAIARALIHRPQVIVADEPTGNLDPYHARDIIRLLTKINELGTTIVLATHNRDIVNRLGRRVITLVEGRMVRDEEKGRFVL
ncbi:MAG: ATP-binding cassette domain-containing protein [Patescibacteria group bacterium]